MLCEIDTQVFSEFVNVSVCTALKLTLSTDPGEIVVCIEVHLSQGFDILYVFRKLVSPLTIKRACLRLKKKQAAACIAYMLSSSFLLRWSRPPIEPVVS